MVFPHKLIAVVCFVLTLFGCSKDDNKPVITEKKTLDASVEYIGKDIAYGTDPAQTFDIYLPANRTKNTETIILIHGGGWNTGSKEDMNMFVDLIRSQIPYLGVVNINYRLASKDKPAHPMQAEDVTKAINTIVANKDYYVMSNQFGMAGTSAGAHLSMLWAYNYDTNKNIKLVSSIVGPTNFIDAAYLKHKNPVVTELIKNIYGLEELTIPFLKEVSPLHQVKKDAPATILFYGAKDTIVPINQGKDLHKKLDSLNVTNEFTLYPEQGHGWKDIKAIQDTWFKLKAFIKTHMPEEK